MTTKKIALIVLVVGLLMGTIAFLSGGVKNLAWQDGKLIPVDESNGGKIITVDETYNSFSEIDINLSVIDNIIVKEGDNFSVKGQNFEDSGGLKAELNGSKLVVGPSVSGTHSILNLNFANMTSRQKCEVVIT